MERKDFLRGIGVLGLGGLIIPMVASCSTDDQTTSTSEGTDGDEIDDEDTGGTTDDSCSVTPTETAGPFPTITPSSLVTNDIRSDRTGVLLTVNITIRNADANDALLSDAIVDIWHCDRQGNYSEYGGTNMQSTDYTTVHFLRGRQTTNSEGQVSFASIFPGWYSGRATHIHVHVYNASGNSLLVTQIAFPEGTDSAVATVNASTANGYTKGMTGYTYNASDNVFSDGAECQIADIAGSIANGYVLESTIKVSA